MKALVMTTTGWRQKARVVVSVGALIGAVGCSGATPLPGAAAPTSSTAATQPGLPVVVSCAPAQRAIVRPAIVNGAAMSQVECVAGEPQPIGSAPSAQPRASAVPVSYRPSADQPTDDGALEDAGIVPALGSTRAVRTAHIVNGARHGDERVVRRRSVRKSAVIIGSSTGAGAGLGAAIGGKKGALIGAAIGGGGAAIWDQITRRQD